MKTIVHIAFLLIVVSCSPKEHTDQASTTDELKIEIEAITLLGDTLRSPATKPGKALDNYFSAKQKYQNNPNNIDSIIWYGRRTAYLGYFQKSIEIYTMGIEKYPEEAQFYRHRGHRYISIRQYAKAIEDYKKAVTLIEGKEDQIEKDGLPNSRNLPLSTLHGNIWYHLGLAYYLNHDMENALMAYSNRTVTEKYDDNMVSGGHWLYMINRRLGNASEADAVVDQVTKDMDIIENMAYHEMCLFYNGLLTEEELMKDSTNVTDPVLYGLANWYLYDQQDTVKAKKYYNKILNEGSVFSFAYLAAEADWDHLTNQQSY